MLQMLQNCLVPYCVVQISLYLCVRRKYSRSTKLQIYLPLCSLNRIFATE